MGTRKHKQAGASSGAAGSPRPPFPLRPLRGSPAPEPPPEQRVRYRPARGTRPNPAGRISSTSSQLYEEEKQAFDELCAAFRHYFGLTISRSLLQRAMLWVFMAATPALLTQLFRQAERFAWEDHRRVPGPSDRRRRPKKPAAGRGKAGADASGPTKD